MSDQAQGKKSPRERAEDLSFRSSRIEHYRSILRSQTGNIYRTLTFAYAGGLLSLAAIISAANIKGDGIATLVSSGEIDTFRRVGTGAIILISVGVFVSMYGLFYSFRNAEMQRDSELIELEKIIYGEAKTKLPKESQLLKLRKDLFKILAKVSIWLFCFVTIAEAWLIFMMFHR